MGRNKPHADKPRPTPFGQWLTDRRLASDERMSDVAVLLADVEPRLANQGRVSELESGKRVPSAQITEALYAHFRERLGDHCPPPPVV